MKRLARLLLVTALLYGTGAHWAAIQGVAWTNMVVERLSTQGFAGALATTFSGEKPCGVCIVVDRGARAELPERVVTTSVDFIAVGPVRVAAPVLSSHPVRTAATSVPEAFRRPDSPPPKTSPAA